MSRKKSKSFKVNGQHSFFLTLQNKKTWNYLHEKTGTDDTSLSYLDLTANLVVKKDCGGRWVSVKCLCDNGKHRRLMIGGCMDENCISCGPSINYRRFTRAIKRFKAKDYDQPLMYTIFTVPPGGLREKALNIGTWQYWTKCIIDEMKKGYGLEYALVSYHPTGKNEEKFHPHLNVVWIQKRGLKHKLDLGSLRYLWAKIIKAKDGVVVIYHEWAKQDFQKYHIINYVVRPFPGWKFWRGKAVRWYGKYPKGVDCDPGDWICPVCGEKIEVVGVIADYDRNSGRPVYLNGMTWSCHNP